MIDSNIYDGEIWDSRLEEAEKWRKMVILLEEAEVNRLTNLLVERINLPSVSLNRGERTERDY